MWILKWRKIEKNSKDDTVKIGHYPLKFLLAKDSVERVKKAITKQFLAYKVNKTRATNN